MSIITISRGSFSRGADVAEKVAKRLGFACLGREALIEAASEYDVPEIKLLHAIEDPPSVLDRLTGGRMRYITLMRAALLRRFCQDNVVYHGVAAGLFLIDVPHAISVRVLADIDDRVRSVREREGVADARARQLIKRRDKARRLWGLRLHGLELDDASRYDAVVHVGKMGTDGAADMICSLAESGPFRTTPESQALLEDLALEASLAALVVELDGDLAGVEISASGGRARIGIRAHAGVKAGTSTSHRAYFIKELRASLQRRASELATVTVELIDV